MERICPYLALADDGRTVAHGYDPEHRCHALAPPGALERSRQVQLCLTEAHARCERFLAARTASLAASSGLPRVAPDVDFGRTRLILEPEPAWRKVATAPRLRPSPRIVLFAGVAAAAVALVVLGNLLGIVGAAPRPTASATPSASASVTASSVPTPGSSSAGPSASAPTSVASTTAPTLSPAPSQRTYVVKSGDTLLLIAQTFGTTVGAIQAANGLTGEIINVGQVLIIP